MALPQQSEGTATHSKINKHAIEILVTCRCFGSPFRGTFPVRGPSLRMRRQFPVMISPVLGGTQVRNPLQLVLSGELLIPT